MKITIVYRLFVFLIIIFIFKGDASALTLREKFSIPLEEGVQIHGISSGNIIFQYDHKLIFLNRRWKVRGELAVEENSCVEVAQSGKYYVVIENQETASAQARVFTVYDYRQVPIWGGIDIVDGQYFISPKGDYFLAVSGDPSSYEYKLHLYHQDRAPEEFELGYFSDIIFSEDGQYFLVNCNPKKLKLFSSDGEKIMEWENQRISVFGPDGDRTAHYLNRVFSIFQGSQEKFKKAFNRTTLDDILLNKDKDRAILMFDSKLVVVDLEDESVLWEYPTGIKGGTYTSADISPNNIYIACGVDINLGTGVEREKRHVTGYLHVYDIYAYGREKLKFNYSKYGKGIPEVKFLPDNRTIAVQTKEALHFVEMR